MMNDALAMALGEVEDRFILSAERLRRKSPLRSAVIGLLAAALAAALTLMTAAAVSEEVRQAVFGLFRVENALDVEGANRRLDEPGDPDPAERTPGHSRGEYAIMEGLKAEHYRIDGYFEEWHGFLRFIDEDWNLLGAYYPKGGELIEVTNWREVDTVVNGVEVSFKWFEYDGNIFPLTPDIEVHDHDRLQNYSVVDQPGIGDKLFITAPLYDADSLPVVYDLKTGEISDPFAGRKWEAPRWREHHFLEWTFTPDIKYALLNVSDYDNTAGEGFYLADTGNGDLYDLRELSGLERVSGAWLYGDQAVICWYLSPGYRYEIRAVELGTWRVMPGVSEAPMVHTWGYDRSDMLESGEMTEEELRQIEYSEALKGLTGAGVGEAEGLYLVEGARSALWVYEGGEIDAIDLLTGERYAIPGLTIPEGGEAHFTANATGDKLLTDEVEISAESGEYCVTSVKVLDLEAHTCTVLGRTETGFHGGRNPHFFGSGDRIALEDSEIDYEDGEGEYAYMYIFSFYEGRRPS